KPQNHKEHKEKQKNSLCSLWFSLYFAGRVNGIEVGLAAVGPIKICFGLTSPSSISLNFRFLASVRKLKPSILPFVDNWKMIRFWRALSRETKSLLSVSSVFRS